MSGPSIAICRTAGTGSSSPSPNSPEPNDFNPGSKHSTLKLSALERAREHNRLICFKSRYMRHLFAMCVHESAGWRSSIAVSHPQQNSAPLFFDLTLRIVRIIAYSNKAKQFARLQEFKSCQAVRPLPVLSL